MSKLRVSFLHLAPVAGDIGHNRHLVEEAVRLAAAAGADWVITPELCIPGYLFMDQIGTDWILPQPDGWMRSFCRLVADHKLTVFLSHPERDSLTNNLYNTVFVIDPQGRIAGKQRKINVLHGAEAWSSPGLEINTVRAGRYRVGILVCGDGYKNEIAEELKNKGAQVLVSPVSWGPGQCGPRGEWEQRTVDTGPPVLVCNRSGVEDIDYRLAESVVAQGGERLLTSASDCSVVLSFDWDMDAMTLLSQEFQRAYL